MSGNVEQTTNYCVMNDKRERLLLLWHCCGVYFIFWFSDKAISSVISAVNFNLLIRFFDVFEFSVKCNNLID